EVSIIKLFIAGIVPGFLLAALFMFWLGLYATIRRGVTPDAEDSFTWGDRLRGLIELGPVVFLMAMIIGSMYAGIASPTEAAASGPMPGAAARGAIACAA